MISKIIVVWKSRKAYQCLYQRNIWWLKFFIPFLISNAIVESLTLKKIYKWRKDKSWIPWEFPHSIKLRYNPYKNNLFVIHITRTKFHEYSGLNLLLQLSAAVAKEKEGIKRLELHLIKEYFSYRWQDFVYHLKNNIFFIFDL